MKKLKVGINGFGRIGRVTMRCLWDHPDFDRIPQWARKSL